ncbi:YtxH domain-containing protein [Rhodopseudomonas palustris]|uniref:Late embryogenesis abundant protein n=1 Tax=Rhodopseudomonas palustris (strain BisB18) TaxID=316056 RepID=Q20XL4_RHOPB
MAEQSFKSTTPSNSSVGNSTKQSGSAPQSLRGVTEQTVAAGRDLKEAGKDAGRDIKDKAGDFKDKVSELAGSSAETIKHQAAEFTEAAKDFAAQAGDKIKERVHDQQGVGADYVGNLAETMRRAAREFDQDLPFAASYIRKAASKVEGVSDSVRNGDLQDLVAGAQSFARRQPTAFLGLAVLAGFGVVRFLKSSGDNAGGSADTGRGTSQRATSDDNRGYRDEFTS